jgi:hypothetical protein
MGRGPGHSPESSTRNGSRDSYDQSVTSVDTVAPDTLGHLGDTVDAMVEGRGSRRILLPTGAPGAGKSTALDGLGRMLAGRGMRVHRVVADEIGRRRPYGLMSSLLRPGRQRPRTSAECAAHRRRADVVPRQSQFTNYR